MRFLFSSVAAVVLGHRTFNCPSGPWTRDSCWNGGTKPSPDDDVIIENVSVNFSTPQCITVRSLTLGQNAVLHMNGCGIQVSLFTWNGGKILGSGDWLVGLMTVPGSPGADRRLWTGMTNTTGRLFVKNHLNITAAQFEVSSLVALPDSQVRVYGRVEIGQGSFAVSGLLDVSSPGSKFVSGKDSQLLLYSGAAVIGTLASEGGEIAALPMPEIRSLCGGRLAEASTGAVTVAGATVLEDGCVGNFIIAVSLDVKAPLTCGCSIQMTGDLRVFSGAPVIFKQSSRRDWTFAPHRALLGAPGSLAISWQGQALDCVPASLGPTVSPTTLSPTTLSPTTLSPTTLSPTTKSPTTNAPNGGPPGGGTPSSPTPRLSKAPTSRRPTSAKPTKLPTTNRPTKSPTIRPSRRPTTVKPSRAPTTTRPTKGPTTRKPTTVKPTRPPTTFRPSRMPTTFRNCARFIRCEACTKAAEGCRWVQDVEGRTFSCTDPGTEGDHPFIDVVSECPELNLCHDTHRHNNCGKQLTTCSCLSACDPFAQGTEKCCADYVPSCSRARSE